MNEFEVLGIDRLATPDQIKKAYRKESQKWHPDRNKAKDAEARFKLVQEAYQFIQTGKSMTGQFRPKKQKAVKPAKPEFKPNYEPFMVHKIEVPCTFDDVFNGGRYRVPQTNMFVKIPKGVFSGQTQRLEAASLDLMESMIFDVVYQVSDPSGFYSIRSIAGKSCLYCEYQASIASVLAEQPAFIRNADSKLPDLAFNLEIDLIKIDYAGLPDASGVRSPLYVKVNPIYSSISKTRDDTLYALRTKIDEQLNRHHYTQNQRKFSQS